MDKVTFGYNLPTKKGVTTRLWALCEQVAIITGTNPKRWLRAGEWALERAMIDFGEATTRDINGYCRVKNKAAYLTWLIRNHSKPSG